jgi:hypothetical protein
VGRSPRGSCSCTTIPRLTGHLQPTTNWSTWASSVLITHPVLRIWPRRTTTCFWTEQKTIKGHHFSSDTKVIAALETWLDGHSECFLSGFQNLWQRAKKCSKLRGEYIEYIPCLVAVACFLPGRAKDLSAPLCICSPVLYRPLYRSV